MEHKFEHSKTYRYEVIHGENPSQVLYVLHGYGQLAKFFIRKFKNLPEDLMIVAPEGMHRFYQKGSSGRVGASWMTKEAREDDILDNISWLDQLDQIISEKYKLRKKHLLGFSQGGATAARWNSFGRTNFDSLLLWACVFPPDIKPADENTKVNQSYFIIGDQDEFYTTDNQKELINFYADKGYKCVQYEGKHDIQDETLVELIRQIK